MRLLLNLSPPNKNSDISIFSKMPIILEESLACQGAMAFSYGCPTIFLFWWPWFFLGGKFKEHQSTWPQIFWNIPTIQPLRLCFVKWGGRISLALDSYWFLCNKTLPNWFILIFVSCMSNFSTLNQPVASCDSKFPTSFSVSQPLWDVTDKWHGGFLLGSWATPTKKKLPGIWQIAMGNATKASPGKYRLTGRSSCWFVVFFVEFFFFGGSKQNSGNQNLVRQNRSYEVSFWGWCCLNHVDRSPKQDARILHCDFLICFLMPASHALTLETGFISRFSQWEIWGHGWWSSYKSSIVVLILRISIDTHA